MQVAQTISLTLGAWLFCCQIAHAAPVNQPLLLAGEIVIGAEPGKAPEKKSGTARQQVNKARSWSKDSPSGDADADNEGILAPRQEVPGGSAREQRLRARDYQRGSEQNRAVSPPTEEPTDMGTTAERARDQRNRAAGYLRPRGIEFTGQTGSDGIPLVNCPDANNTAGIIGDEQARSGNVIQILVKGKPLKVRCR